MDNLLEQLKAELERVQEQLASTPISHQLYDKFAQLRARERVLRAQIAGIEAGTDRAGIAVSKES